MSKKQKIYFGILLLIGLLYFCVFIFPNLTGAKDASMLSVFEHDEFAQYPNVVHMLQPEDSLKATLHNFLVYLHCYYGYPFYFFSALSILPVKWSLGSDWTKHTQTIVFWLRQLINVLPILLAAFILVREQLKSFSPWKALLTFLLMLTLPAVVRNNLWWHPDSLLTLFCVLTIFCLILDDGKFGKYFYLSGLTCALAIGTKFIGSKVESSKRVNHLLLPFVLTIKNAAPNSPPDHVYWAVKKHTITFNNTLYYLRGFLLQTFKKSYPNPLRHFQALQKKT